MLKGKEMVIVALLAAMLSTAFGRSAGIHVIPAGRNPVAPAANVRPQGVTKRSSAVPTPQPPPSTGIVPARDRDGVGLVPYVSDMDIDGSGHVNGYHVKTVEYSNDPFAPVQGIANGIRGGRSSRSSSMNGSRATRKLVDPPSVYEAEKFEEQELLAFRKKWDYTAKYEFISEGVFRSKRLAVVRNFYRSGNGKIVPRYDLSGFSWQSRPQPIATGDPPSDEAIMELFNSGTEFEVVADVAVTIACGACKGSGEIPVAILTDGRGGASSENVECSRCGGSGKMKKSLPLAHRIVRHERFK